MKEFYLPYNFIPVTGIIKKNQDDGQRLRATYDYDTGCEQQEITEQGASSSAKIQARHDLWQTGRHSGKFTCRLCTISPTVVGNEHHSNEYTDRHSNEQTPDHPTVVCQYTWNDQPAIPANSLRGMIASLAETLSQSALRVLHPDLHPAFANIDADLPPWNEERAQNSGLTPAELLFGVVENNKECSKDRRGESLCSPVHSGQEKDTHNLASRVRFYDAVLPIGETREDVLGDSVVLRELSSPKPKGYEGEGEKKFKTDRPSLYFRRSLADPEITYDDLREYIKAPSPPHPLPHGRKFYLLREKPDELDSAEYRTKPKQGESTLDVKNKLLCEPIKPGTQFEFSIAFDNLSDAELTLLKTALVPDPQHGFYHRLGLGKPLGMGIVQIEITKTEYIDRKERYAVDGLLNGGGKTTAEAAADDASLIDDETLKQVRKAGSLKALRAGVPVRWRKGYLKDEKKEEAAPLPQLNPAHEFLPVFYELRSSAVGTKARSTVCGEQAVSNFIVEPGEEETPAVQWLKDEITAMDKKSFDQLTEKELEDRIVGPALSKLWGNIADPGRKTAVKELVLAAADKRKWAYRWKSGGSKRAKKKYDAWSL
ncbi:RAMP superfamily CRISPR-associated protein [Candidatus Electrothrix sp.]|uniref:RAMP superfamily CRISPR-associated protein n=1 Tax=Candidatus Electrothrix sp. TaxID=2170559 RepID=UPI004056F316